MVNCVALRLLHAGAAQEEREQRRGSGPGADRRGTLGPPRALHDREHCHRKPEEGRTEGLSAGMLRMEGKAVISPQTRC